MGLALCAISVASSSALVRASSMKRASAVCSKYNGKRIKMSGFSMSQVSEKTLREPRHVVDVTGSKIVIAAGGQNKVTPL